MTDSTASTLAGDDLLKNEAAPQGGQASWTLSLASVSWGPYSRLLPPRPPASAARGRLPGSLPVVNLPSRSPISRLAPQPPSLPPGSPTPQLPAWLPRPSLARSCSLQPMDQLVSSQYPAPGVY